MKIVISFLYIIIIMFFHSGAGLAQDIHFSQYTMTPLVLNPALTGSQNKMRGIINHRSQWGGIASPYVTSLVSWDMEIKGNKKKKESAPAVGFTVLYDKAGESRLRTFQANFYYAYQLYLSRNSFLGAGLYGGYMQRSINYSGLQWMNQFDGNAFNPSLSSGEPVGTNAINGFDAGGGINYNYRKGDRYYTANDSKRVDVGISVSHINRPRNSFYTNSERLEMKYTAYFNALIGVGNSRLSMAPQLIYQRQKQQTEILIGMMARYRLNEHSIYTGFRKSSAISFGLHYRNGDAVIPSVLFEISGIAIGLSYDATVSKLSGGNGRPGALELALRFSRPDPFGVRGK